jgi:GNAT superfamily N-acetyltransferase
MDRADRNCAPTRKQRGITVQSLFWATAAKVQRRLKLHFGLEVFRVVTRPLAATGAPEGRLKHIRYGLLSETETLPHCADLELELPESHVRAAFRRGDLCVGAIHGEKLVGYQWLAFGPTPHVDGVWVAFDRRSRYSYKKFVRSDYRGQRIAAGLSSHADALCLQRGRVATVGLIALHNDASWRASARLGSRTSGYAGYVQFADRFIAFRSSGARRCDLRFYKPAAALSTKAPTTLPSAA